MDEQTAIETGSKRRARRRALYRALACLPVLVVVGLVASWVVASALVAPAPRRIGDPPDDFPATKVFLESDSGTTIAGWHVSSSDQRGVIVLLHGMHECRLAMLERARFLYDAGYSIVMIDFQAHGESSGKQISVGHLEKHDVRAAVKYAKEMHAGEPIGVIGVSMGGAAALLASPLEIDALVLESVYPDIHNRVSARLGPLSDIPAELLLVQLKLRLGISRLQLCPKDQVSAVNCPLFVISGSEDLHTTAAETKDLFARAHDPKELWLVEGAAHVDLCKAAAEQYQSRVLQFLDHSLHRRD